MATSSDSDVLRLTDATKDQANFVLFNNPLPSNQGISITFDFFSYGGTGGDGINLFFIDGAVSPTAAGSFGGSLGYAQSSGTPGNPGLAGAYVGIGFDEFGNYSTAQSGRVGGPGRSPDTIAVRGGVNNSYRFLTSSGPLSISLDNPGPGATQENSKRTAKVDLTAAGVLSVALDLNNDGAFAPSETVISNYDLITTGQNGPLPATLKFGFSASTGSSNNIHEVIVRNLPGPPKHGRTVIGGSGNDVLIGSSDDDILIGKGGGDQMTGGGGADRFVYSGSTQAAALQESLVRRPDRITDFNGIEGDRIQLDFDNNLSTSELPSRLFNAGRQTAPNLAEAVKAAYSDKNGKRPGKRALRGNEAVFFQFGRGTFLSVNDNRTPFARNRDLVINVTGIQPPPRGVQVNVANYFV
jgi:Ca2+-binding RTX toxin-like protein